MRYKSISLMLMGAFAAGCATGSDSHWAKAGATSADFTSDNQSCGARASRVTPTARADQLPGGATAPNNRMDTPPRAWTSGVGERAYMDCMDERGWRVVQR